MHKLIKDIERVSQIELKSDLKGRLKQNIFEEIKRTKPISEQPKLSLISRWVDLVQKIRGVTRELQPSQYFRAVVKERVLEFIEVKEKRGFWSALSEFLWEGRKVLASVTVTALLLLVVFPIQLAPEVLAKQTYLEIEQGKVWIERGGRQILGYNEMILQAEDEVRMETDSVATIYFMDDSLARLAGDTRLRIATLMGVELEVDYGKVWVRTVSLGGGNTRFQVGVQGVNVEVKERATFEVAVEKDSFQVAVLENKVDLKLQQAEGLLKKTLIKNEGVVLIAGEDRFRPIALEENNQWWQKNMEQDKVYLAQLHEETSRNLEQKAGILPDSLFYPVKKLSESAKIAFTFDKLEREKQKLETAEQRLLEAQVMVLQGKKGVGGPLEEFKKTFQSVTEEVKRMEVEEGEKLTEELEGNIKGYKKTLDPVLPDVGLYSVTNTIRETEVLIAGWEEKSKVMLEHAYDRLVEAQEVLEQNENSVLVRAKLLEYRRAMQQAVAEIQQLPYEERKGMAQQFLEHKLKDLAVLKGLLAEDSSFQSEIEQVKLSLIYDLNRLILSLNEALGEELEAVLAEQKNDEFCRRGFWVN